MNRAEVLRARRKRRRLLLSLAFILVLSALVTAGVGLGAAVGVAAGRVRDSGVLTRLIPAEEPSLPTSKTVPPVPVDISGPAGACAASSLTLTATAERPEFYPGEILPVHITITNSGRYPCLVNGGMENLRLRMVDTVGTTYWSASDCGLVGTRQLLMGPGNQVEWVIDWDGRASAPDRCTEGQPFVAGGAWSLIASLAEVAHSDSEPGSVHFHGYIAPEPIPEPEPEPLPIPELEPQLVSELAGVPSLEQPAPVTDSELCEIAT